MLIGAGLRLWCGLGALSSVALAQCYDLTSVQLYEVKGRFQERWDKPIWNAKPGEGNFQLDELPWLGGLPEFVIFAIGQAQKTESGWVPLRKSGVPENWCEVTPQRSSALFCYWVPYQTPPAGAFRVPPTKYDRETWSLGRDGRLRYTRRTQGESAFDHTYDFGSAIEAVLDLNTGAYSVVGSVHSKGHYTQRIPEGVELWRDTTLSARAKLMPQPCSVSMRQAARVRAGAIQEEEAHPLPICIARFKTEGGKTSLEFITNPKNAVSAQGCIVAHEGPMPQQDRPVAQNAGQGLSASIPGKPR